MNAFAHLLRWGLGAVMLYAGVVKALDPAAFASALGNYRLFPEFLLAPLGTVLPWLEIACGGALILNRLTLGAASICVGLGLGFVAALASAWWRGLDVDCGCFGGGSAGSGNVAPALLRAAAILAAAVGLWVLTARRARR